MRIGIDATCWANGRGYGRFTRELLPAMSAHAPSDSFVCFVDARAAECFDLVRRNVRAVRVQQAVSPTIAAGANGRRAASDMLRLTRAVAREPLDVFFSPSIYTYFPLPLRLPSVVTVHDAIAERYPELTLPSRQSRVFWRAKVSLALWQARLILTVSNFAAEEISTVLRVARGRIRVALEAPARAYAPSESPAAVAAVAAKVGLPPASRWFTYVGGFSPHKNVDLIVKAHASAARACAAAPHLVLVGALTGDVFHGDQERIRSSIAEAGTEALVHWAGFLPDEELRHLHSGALALLLPSMSEGFGLPAIEAAACGTPVIATTASPLPELLVGGGIFVPPGDEAALTSAMFELLANEPARSAMGLRAHDRAAELSWARGAQAALGALQEAAAG
jgi:glycosyltransferase involved in cell wall biosynthesis